TGEKFEKRKSIHRDRIKRAVDNMTSILNDFLSLSKMEEGKVEATYVRIDVRSRIMEIVDEMEAVKKPGQTIRYRHEGQVEPVLLDEHFLRNTLMNLISNAIKFSPDDGGIAIVSRIVGCDFILEVADEG